MSVPVVSQKYRGTVEFERVKAELITAARYQGLITYQDVAAIMGLPPSGSNMGKETGHLLGEISEDERAAGRPMLSALAVSVEGKPGGGFAVLAKDLGLLPGEADWEAFWQRERAAVYRCWAPKRQ